MKYLKIENNKAFYYDGSGYKEIDKINKDGLLSILEAAETEDFEVDEFNADALGNKAHQIIYENIYNKLKQFLEDKDQFRHEVDELFKGAIEGYSAELTEEFEEPQITSDDSSEINIEDIPF